MYNVKRRYDNLGWKMSKMLLRIIRYLYDCGFISRIILDKDNNKKILLQQLAVFVIIGSIIKGCFIPLV